MERPICLIGRGKKLRCKFDELFIIFGSFILLYKPPILFFNSMHLVGALAVFYLLIHIGPTADMLRSLKLGGLVLGVLLWFAYLLYSGILLNQEDWIFTLLPLYFLIDIIPFGMAARIISIKNKWHADHFIDMIIIAAIIQAVFAMAAFFSPEVQSFFVSLFLDKEYDNIILEASKRRFYGLAAGLTFDMPIFQTVIAMIAIYPSRKLKLSNYIIAIILFFSAIINARNAIVVAMIGLFAMVVLDRRPLEKRIKYGIVLLAMVFAVSVILPPILKTAAPLTFNWIARGFKEILGFLLKGDTKTAGNYFAYITDPDKYRFPDDLLGCLFGVGHPTMGMASRYGYASDIGYINDLWRGGIVYIILLYTFFAAIMWSLRKHPDSRVSFLGTFMLIMYPFVNIKGVAANTNAFSHLLFLLYIVTLNESYHGQGNILYQHKLADGLR